MIELKMEQTATKIAAKAKKINFSWQDSPPIKHLLDAISSIVAQEYIEMAKQNPDVFSEIASPPSAFAKASADKSGARNGHNT